MNENTVQFKPLDASYLDDVLVIENSSFSSPFTQGMIENELVNPRAHYLVGLLNDKCVAYGGFWQIFDEAHIINIAVYKGYRRQGIGEKLVLELMRKARKLDIISMTLEVRRSNTAAQALYNKLGFIEVGERLRYYEDNNEDALIMWNYNIAETLNRSI